MHNTLTQLSSHPQLKELLALRRGIEKEGLRAYNDGQISQASHPKGLGSALTHEHITTDYSEALLEFITPVFNSAQEALSFLEVAHRFSYANMSAELIWPNSMPCVLENEMSIPIADYGRSNLGKLKQVYRHGLWHRYGRIMQCIAGIHYNFSLPEQLIDVLFKQQDAHTNRQDFVSSLYFGLIRNFRRYTWLLHYLFGASPAVCKSFFTQPDARLQGLHKNTAYMPYATSLRMSDLGYHNNAQAHLDVCYNHLDTYIDTLSAAIKQPYKAYEDIGMLDDSGEYKQLNTHLLQIENEYYSDIRPKRLPQDSEKPLEALAKYGVQYIEVRSTDLNPFLPLGINTQQICFLDTFLLFCALKDSPKMNDKECEQVKENRKAAVMYGRDPEMELQTLEGKKHLRQWGLELIDELIPVAKLLDKSQATNQFIPALMQQKLKLIDDALTPSAQILNKLKEQNIEFSELTLSQAKEHRKILSEPLGEQIKKRWQQKAKTSLEKQAQIEQADTISFTQYLANY